jgi:hypothetical protein
MTKNNQREDLRQLLKSPQLRLVEYSADPFVQRRVGQVLGKASMHNHIQTRGRDQRPKRRMLAFTPIPGHLGMSVEGRQRTVKEVAMTKMVLITAALIAGIGFAVAQDQVPGNKSEAATPAPPAQQNAPPDAKAEASAPALKMDSGAEKKLPASEDATSGQDTTRSRP